MPEALCCLQECFAAHSEKKACEASSAPLSSWGTYLGVLAQKRVQAVKEWYSQARTYLHIDDAIRIQGYLNTLESLGISFIAVRLPVVITTLMSKSAVCLV